jgi:hypothetical protein
MFTASTHEHAYSMLFSTCPQSIGRHDELGESDNPSSATFGSMAPENSRAGTAMPKAVHPGRMGLELCNAKSKHGPSDASLSQGFVPSTSMLSMPSSVSKVAASTQVGAPCKRVMPLPSCAYGINTSCACIVGASQACVGTSCIDPSSDASHADSPSIGASWCMTVGRKELRVALVGSPMLIADNDARVMCGGVTGHAADRRMIGVAEV